MSAAAKAFCTALLEPDPSLRLEASQALEHEWLEGAGDGESLEERGAVPASVEEVEDRRDGESRAKGGLSVKRGGGAGAAGAAEAAAKKKKKRKQKEARERSSSKLKTVRWRPARLKQCACTAACPASYHCFMLFRHSATRPARQVRPPAHLSCAVLRTVLTTQRRPPPLLPLPRPLAARR